jgi:hypothetical protein
MEKYSKLPIPEKSVWDKKSYDPIKWVYNLRETHPSWLEIYFFDNYFSIKNFIKDLIRFFRKILRWIPILWKDRDYDDYFIFEIVKKKIFFQREYLISNNRHTNISNDNHWMTLCLNLIERIQDSYYELEYMNYEQSEIKFVEIDSSALFTKEDYDIINSESEGKKLYEMKKNYIVDNTLEYINKYPLDRERTLKIIKKNWKIDVSDYKNNDESKKKLLLHMSSFRHKKAIRVLFLVLTQKIENWWD